MNFIQRWKAAFVQQDLLVSRAAACAAAAFARATYGVFIDGVIVAPHLPVYLAEMQRAGVAVHYAVLLPPIEVLLKRAAAPAMQIPVAGGLTARMSDTIKRVHSMFTDAGWRLDNSALTPEQTADAIMEASGRGDCLIWPSD